MTSAILPAIAYISRLAAMISIHAPMMPATTLLVAVTLLLVVMILTPAQMTSVTIPAA